MRSLDVSALRDHLSHTIFSTRSDGDDHFGVEIEMIPFHWIAGDERPHHVPLHARRSGDRGTLEMVSTFACEHGIKVKTPEGHISGCCAPPREGDFTFEPGGQVEFSCAPRPTPAAAYHESTAILDELNAYALAHGVDYQTIGFNPWLDADEIGLNTEAARYRSMDAVYQTIGPFGRRKMRQSATIHVNLDFGGPDRLLKRWQAGQLLSPLAMGTFAYSPLAEGETTGYRSYRGRVWTEVDPSRCGFPAAFLADPLGSPIDQYLDFALDARVLMIERDGTVQAQTEPLSFRRWLEEGADGLHPTLDDWTNHLTTLFPEVRPRGFLELRSADSQSRAFWSVPLTWWTTLLCDDVALDAVLELLTVHGRELQSLYLTAARDGLTDSTLGTLAARLYRIAEQALPRFPAGFFSTEMQRAFAVYGERFTLVGRTPADALLAHIEANGLTGSTLAELGGSWCRAVDVDVCTDPEELRRAGEAR